MGIIIEDFQLNVSGTEYNNFRTIVLDCVSSIWPTSHGKDIGVLTNTPPEEKIQDELCVLESPNESEALNKIFDHITQDLSTSSFPLTNIGISFPKVDSEGYFSAFQILHSLCYNKNVGVRLTSDAWSTYTDLKSSHVVTKHGIDIYFVKCKVPNLTSFNSQVSNTIDFTSYVHYDDLGTTAWSVNHVDQQLNYSIAFERVLEVPTKDVKGMISLNGVTFKDDTDEIDIHIRVRNVTLEKDVIARVTQNAWKTYEDVQATYVESIDEDYDIFSIVLRRSDNISFALKYTPGNDTGVYWDNNCSSNYKLSMMPIKVKCIE